MMTPYWEHRGVKAMVEARRRYGTTTYTWLYFVKPDGSRVAAGDPWPAVSPAKKEIQQLIDRLLEN